MGCRGSKIWTVAAEEVSSVPAAMRPEGETAREVTGAGAVRVDTTGVGARRSCRVSVLEWPEVRRVVGE